MIIETDHLTKKYSGGILGREPHYALHDVSLDIREGEIFALLGLNGAGKTTFTRLLLDHLRPTSGTILLFGKPVAEGSWKGSTGYLPELFRLQKNWTPESLLSHLGSLSGLRPTELRTRIDVVLSEVGLSDARYRSIGTFSKGMVQRLGIAQAILHRPRLLILDEPTDGLDPLGRKEVRELLIHLRAVGVSILLNSHLLSDVELIADRVGILHRGMLKVQGTLRDLLPSGSHYLIQIATDPHSLSEWAFQHTENGWVCTVCDVSSLDSALQQFKRKGIVVTSVTPVRATLEDAFTHYIS